MSIRGWRRIPEERMKMRAPLIVSLSPQALAILEELRTLTGQFDCSFRALASTILNETGFRPDVIERQLAHVERNKLRTAYHRSEYLEECRKLMDWLGAYIESTAKDQKVVLLRRQAGA